MRVMLHAVISIFLMALLVLINPLVAIVTSLALGACMGGIYLAFRRGALAAGRVRPARIPPGFARRTRFSAASRS